MKGWTAPTREPWGLVHQCIAAGLEVPTGVDDAYTFLAARLLVHVCPRKDCEPCRAAARLGWRTLRITADDIITGRALDAVGRALNHQPELRLFE